jgi:hypothetical protein
MHAAPVRATPVHAKQARAVHAVGMWPVWTHIYRVYGTRLNCIHQCCAHICSMRLSPIRCDSDHSHRASLRSSAKFYAPYICTVGVTWEVLKESGDAGPSRAVPKRSDSEHTICLFLEGTNVTDISLHLQPLFRPANTGQAPLQAVCNAASHVGRIPGAEVFGCLLMDIISNSNMQPC